MPAEERRAIVVSAALTEFAKYGFEGTPTDAIAKRAGVSQPYLFQLFENKKALYIATVREAFGRAWRLFDNAASQARAIDPSPQNILNAMGEAYCDLLSDRELLLSQLHAYAACGDDKIRAVVRREFSDMYWRIASISGADSDTLDSWFSRGMMMNNIAAIAPDLRDKGEELSLRMLTPIEGQMPK